MSFIDGFLVAVKAANQDKYLTHAREAAAIFRELGATRVVEAWGEDVPEGVHTSFPMAVKREADEVVVFSWIEWPDRATRDTAWGKFMADPRMKALEMPFDGKRVVHGGFATLLDG